MLSNAFSSTFPSTMNRTASFRLPHAVALSFLIATGFLAVGCDSGGSNGGGGDLSGTVTATVDGREASGALGVNFTYATDDGTCSEVAVAEDFEAPGDREFDPELISVRCDGDANQWDEVEVLFNPDGSADGLTLTVTSGGSEIASSSSPNENGELVATAGSVDDS